MKLWIGIWNIDCGTPAYRHSQVAHITAHATDLWRLTEVPANLRVPGPKPALSASRPAQADQCWSAVAVANMPFRQETAVQARTAGNYGIAGGPAERSERDRSSCDPGWVDDRPSRRAGRRTTRPARSATIPPMFWTSRPGMAWSALARRRVIVPNKGVPNAPTRAKVSRECRGVTARFGCPPTGPTWDLT